MRKLVVSSFQVMICIKKTHMFVHARKMEAQTLNSKERSGISVGIKVSYFIYLILFVILIYMH